MYNQIEDILLNISIVIATVWIIKRFWGSFFEEKQNSILSVSLWIVYCIFEFFFGYQDVYKRQSVPLFFDYGILL